MWRVGDVEPVRIMGAEGDPFGSPSPRKTASRLSHLYYASQALAEAAATHRGVGSAERNFGASTRRLKRGVQAEAPIIRDSDAQDWRHHVGQNTHEVGNQKREGGRQDDS